MSKVQLRVTLTSEALTKSLGDVRKQALQLAGKAAADVTTRMILKFVVGCDRNVTYTAYSPDLVTLKALDSWNCASDIARGCMAESECDSRSREEMRRVLRSESKRIFSPAPNDVKGADGDWQPAPYAILCSRLPRLCV